MGILKADEIAKVNAILGRVSQLKNKIVELKTQKSELENQMSQLGTMVSSTDELVKVISVNTDRLNECILSIETGLSSVTSEDSI